MKTIFCSILFFFSVAASAQNSEVIFNEAKQNAYKGEFELAHKIIDSLIITNPTNSDFKKFKASVFSWQQNNDSAIATVQQIKNINKDIKAQNLLSTFLFRNKNYEQALASTQTTLTLDSNQLEAKTIQLDVLIAMKNYSASYLLSKPLKNLSDKIKYINYQSANKYFEKRITTQATKTIQQKTSYDLFSIQYQQKIKSTTLLSTAYLLNRNNQQGIQFQQEAYQQWKKYGYSYASTTYSSSTSFPLFSVAAVHFYPLAKNIETDLGFRYYLGSNKTKSYVPSLGVAYTIKNITFQYRYYKIMSENSNGNSHAFMIKRSLKLPEQYIKLDFGIGTQYDLTTRAYTDLMMVHKGQNIQLSLSQPLTPRMKFTAGVMYTNSILNEKNTTKQVTAQVSLTYKFTTRK